MIHGYEDPFNQIKLADQQPLGRRLGRPAGHNRGIVCTECRHPSKTVDALSEGVMGLNE